MMGKLERETNDAFVVWISWNADNKFLLAHFIYLGGSVLLSTKFDVNVGDEIKPNKNELRSHQEEGVRKGPKIFRMGCGVKWLSL